ncbi:WD40-repeat-containing domain [Trinorchestia longiramus]|nr:WD40-repeat-containing domain [Trinorchestia longiramus]
MLFHEDLSTQITAICPLQQLLLVGHGQHVLVYSMTDDKLVSKMRVFTKVSVHGFHCCMAQEGSRDHLMLVWGQRSFAVLLISSHGLCEVVVSEEVAEDWIVAGSWTSSPFLSISNSHYQPRLKTNVTAQDLVSSPDLSKLPRSEEEINGKVFECKQNFILQTAHSAALVYSLHLMCSPVSTIDAPETLYQILEKREILLYRDAIVGNTPCKNWSLQSCYCGESKAACSMKASLIDRFQCTDKCVLFSGCIITESNLCSEKAALRSYQHSSEGSQSTEDTKGASSVHNLENQCNLDVNSLNGWVCVGGTVMGDLIIWGAAGEYRAGEIVPWHTVKVHKGVVFSVSWDPTLHLLSTTSDDRLVRVWSVQDSCSSNNKTNLEQHSNGKIYLKQCLTEEEKRVRGKQEIIGSASETCTSQSKPIVPSSCVHRTNCSKHGEETTIARQKLCWSNCSVRLTLSCEGHDARAWRSCVLEFKGRLLVVGVGEDSRVCVWGSSGTLLRRWVAHEGASVWCVKPFQRLSSEDCSLVLVTGGGDGAVKRWPLWNLLGGDRSIEPSSLPWNDVNMRKKDNTLLGGGTTNCKKTKINEFWKDKTPNSKSSTIAKPLQKQVTSNSSISKQHSDDEIEQTPLFPDASRGHETASLRDLDSQTASLGDVANRLEDIPNRRKMFTERGQFSHKRNKGQQCDTFVRCLALVSTSHCVLTLDNGQVWLWQLPLYTQPETSLFDCGRDLKADASILHFNTGSELGSLESSRPSLAEITGSQSVSEVNFRDEELELHSSSTSIQQPRAYPKTESVFQNKSIEGTATDSSTWKLVVDDKQRLGGYSTVAVASNSSAVAVCGLHGDVFVWPDILSSSALLTVQAAKNKVVTCIWVSGEELLLSVGSGHLLLYRLLPDFLSLEANFELPPSKQRWCTAAVWLSVPRQPPRCEDTCTEALIVGDRSGSVHLFTKHKVHPTKSIRSVHGSGGVTSVRALPAAVCGALAVTAGRDGWLRYWRCFQPSAASWRILYSLDLKVVSGTRHCGGSWVADVLPWHTDYLVLSFREVHLGVWSVQHRAEVAQVACGGGHRAWDVRVAVGGAGDGRQDLLTVVYLKEGLPQCSYQSLCPRLQPLLTGVSSKPVLCGALLHSSARGAVIALAGEDNSVHLQLVSGGRRSLLSIVSHISAVRCMDVIRPTSREQNQCALNAFMRDPNLTTLTEEDPEQLAASFEQGYCSQFTGDKQVLSDYSADQEVMDGSSVAGSFISNAPSKLEEDDSVWFVTGGGRAQLKVWRCSTQNLEDILENYDMKTSSVAANDTLVSLGSDVDSETIWRSAQKCDDMKKTSDEDVGYFARQSESTGEEARLKNSLEDLDQPSSNQRKFAHPGAASQMPESLPAFPECAEMIDFHLSRGKSSSWRHQQVQVDAEVRHMACSGVWLTCTTAIVAVASSDGSLR